MSHGAFFPPRQDALSYAIWQFIGPDNEGTLESQLRAAQRNHTTERAVVLNPDKDMALDLARQGYTRTYRFIVLPSADAPRWLFPLGDRRWTLAGAQIYTPYASVAQVMKRVLERVIRIGWNGTARHRVLIATRESLAIEGLVTEITGERRPIFSLSLGNQPAVCKLTVQVMRPDGEILGYIKLPLTSVASDLVRHEAVILERLWRFEPLRPHIPRLLHAGTWGEGHLLFQSPLMGDLGPSQFGRPHEEFLKILWNVHRIEKPARTLTAEVGAKWDAAVANLGAKWKDLGREVLRRSTEDLEGQTIRCGISHGDFAPWNTRLKKGKLLLFDWESTDWEAPIYWDRFHFGLQSVTLKKNEAYSPTIRHPGDRACYLLYLMNSVIQYLEEENWTGIDQRYQLLTKGLGRTIHLWPDEVEKKPTNRLTTPSTKLRKLEALDTRPKLRLVTTSWDDGDPNDIRVAELLRSRGLPGTFYIPMSGYRKPMRPADLRTLSAEGFEIGAHGVSHKNLTLCTGEELKREINTCKHKLAQVIGKPVCMFCYPNGRYNSGVIREVKAAGYEGARTTRMLAYALTFDPFAMPTTLHAHPTAKSAHLKNLARAHSVGGLFEYVGRFSRIGNWIALGKRLFDLVVEHGGIWHLYGHSWEIDELGMWSDLEQMLDYVSNRAELTYVTNHELLQTLRSNPQSRRAPEILEEKLASGR